MNPLSKKGLLSVNFSSFPTSIFFTCLSLNITQSECYVSFGMCGLQLIQKYLLVNNYLEMEYQDMTDIISSTFSIAVQSQASVLNEQFHN